jgi:uncharacterized SAM-binding protein YcdF (DUF218 family)
MSRSLRIFQKQGINTIPAPTDFIAAPPVEAAQQTFHSAVVRSMPQADNLQQVTRVLKEYIGMVVYWLRGWL